MDKIYYPLTTDINYTPVLCLDGIITQDDIFKIKEQLKTIDVTAALVGPRGPINDIEHEQMMLDAHKIRKSNVAMLDIDEWSWFYKKLPAAIHQANNINFSKLLYAIEPLQYGEYDSMYSGFYGMHSDAHLDIKNGLKRSLSFSIQLSDQSEYTGGELKIYSEGMVYVANKNVGSITFFDSNVLHEVTPVTSGFRKSIVGWVVGPRA